MIRSGGIAVILAVLGICVFLGVVVVPLFGGAKLGEERSFALGAAPEGAHWLHAEVNEYGTAAFALASDGTLAVYELGSSHEVSHRRVTPEEAPGISAFARDPATGSLALGLTDGRMVIGSLAFASEFMGADAAPPELRELAVGAAQAFGEGVIERVSADLLRASVLRNGLREPVSSGSSAPIRLMDYAVSGGDERLAYLKADGHLAVGILRERRHVLGLR